MRQDLMWASYWGSVDPEVIEKFEKIARVNFPKSYKEIAGSYNGAYVRGKSAFRFFCKSEGSEVVHDLGLMHAFGSIDSLTDTMDWSFKNKPDGLPAGLISFSRDGGGNLLCFDYRKNPKDDRPAVVLWHSDVRSGVEQVSFVADGFDEFLDMLFEA